MVIGLGTALAQPSNATLTIQGNSLGNTPELLAYNSGHFYPGSNTKDWWRYAGVTGARVFLTANVIEATDDIPGHGDGVTDQTSFLARKAALRANPNNPLFINWTYFNTRYNAIGKHGANWLQPNYIFTELRKLGVQIDVNIGASQSIFVINSTNDWAGKWELWQHFYAQAFYLARYYDVVRYQMYNEPDHPNAGGLTQADYLQRLQLCSDAIQSALADVNSIYGKALLPRIIAPVITTASYSGWGQFVVTNRHLNFLGQTDTNFTLLHQYDYHQYNPTPAQFGANLAGLRNALASAMAPEPPLPVSISEFNVHTAANFDTMPDTLDYPTKYPRLGAIAVNLVANGAHELYNFKFSQTDGDAGDAYPVRKNGMHYVDRANTPYNIGGITKAGEVWRLFNKACAPGRERIGITKSAAASELDVLCSYDFISQRYYLFSVNYTTNAVKLNLNLAALGLAPGSKVFVEEVSENTHGAGRLWTSILEAETTLGVQEANSVWLITVSAAPQTAETILVASEDAQVRDGTNKGINYGTNATLIVRNDPNDASNRSVAFLKFQLPTNNLADLDYAVLSLQAYSSTVNTTAQAHVYGITNNAWSQNSLKWNNAPNLKSNVAAGATISRQFVSGQGTDVNLLGQIVASSNVPNEKLIDVTSFIQARSNSTVSFLISQDPRWDVTLPSLSPGDIQPDGLSIRSIEGGSAPCLRLVYRTSDNGNKAPQVIEDSYTTTEGSALVIAAPGVLLNDSDPETNALTAALVSGPSKGTLLFETNGGFRYDPPTNFYGSDSFSYKASDGQNVSRVATVSIVINPTGGMPKLTNVPVNVEAVIRGGAHSELDQDEIAAGYLLIKYNGSPFDTSRKAYFQFDLTGLGANLETQAVFKVTTHTTNAAQRAQLWALNQGYSELNEQITWNDAQANDPFSNDLLLDGPLTGTPVGASFFFSSAISSQYSFTIPRLGDYVFDNSITLVLSGVDDEGNSPGGLRLARMQATLQLTAGLALPQITNHPTSRTNATESTATFSVTATGTSPLRYGWQKDGVSLVDGGNISGATSPTLIVENLSQADAGNYRVVVRNEAGSATSLAATLTVVARPRFTAADVLPSGACHMILSGQSNFTYAIECSTNLQSWVTLTNLQSENGVFEFTDFQAVEFPYRFYRAR